ncbi:MAG: transglycosylase domain-containing protein, partial [Rudaea sp.]
MYTPADDSQFDKSQRRRKRRSTMRKLVSVNPKHVGIKRREKPRNFIWAWIVGVAGLAGASFFTAIIVLIGSVIFGAYTVVTSFAASLPPASQLAQVQVEQSTKIYDRKGNLLYEVVDPQGGRRTVVPLSEIPDIMKKATIATEDPTFYSNPGIDAAGLARAFYFTFVQGRTVGGSTITQQLVKNNLLTSEVTFDRKIREAILSLEVTQKYSKDEILNAYLNTIPYGNLSLGVEAAAQSYFGKDARKLDLGEASLLAGIPQSPTAYDPCVNPDAALGRQKNVLRLMYENHFITTDDADAAVKEMTDYIHSQQFSQQCHPSLNPEAPHFVDFVRQELETRYGPDALYKGGLQVYTSLDPDIQKITEEEARKQIATLKWQHVTDAAVVVIDPKTGEILAMLGSPNYFDQSIHGQVNMAVSPRQPGSSIKPFNYLAALRKG